MKKKFIFILFVTGLLVIGGCTGSTSSDHSSSFKGEIKIFKSPSCGCCENYAKYMENQGFDVEVNDVSDMEGIKNQYDIPSGMESCHTSIVGDYVVEGHVPVEAVNKLLEEKPDIEGIGLAGMPTASPGMPGPKQKEWRIYAMTSDGQETFMTI